MKLVGVLLYTFLCFFFLNIEGMSILPMPFRVGFEFQMSGELCKWAMEDYSFQKSSICKIGTTDYEELFHIELDGPDIEFVTIPFSHHPGEKDKLSRCIDLITCMTERMLQLTENDRKTTMEEWFEDASRIDGINIQKNEAIFGRIQREIIEKPTDGWSPTWQPQITLQHPLRSSINLFAKLFEGTFIQQNIQESKPFYNPVQDGEKPLYNTAIGGLMFLLAHELCGINKSTVYQPNEVISLLMKGKYVTAGSPVSDTDMISDTLESFRTVHQFDAKRRIIFMSRRPFSDMLGDILREKSIFASDEVSLEKLASETAGFAKVFRKAMAANRFYKTCEAKSEREPRVEVAQSFWRANYAEQFFDKTGHVLDLMGLLNYFDEEIRILPDLSGVLANGILSTAMLRHIDLEKARGARVISTAAENVIVSMRSPEYYDKVLFSVDHPDVRLFLNINTENGIQIDALPTMVSQREKKQVVADLFSPPFPLDKEDAMGFFREGAFLYHYCQQEYGSAIVEVRAIQHVKFLLDKRNTSPSGFLSNPSYVKNEVLSLYDWLGTLTIVS